MLLKDRLAEWELDRVTAAEVCLDELMATLERHNVNFDGMHGKLADLSDWLDNLLLDAQGPERRYETLRGARDKLDAAFPAPTE